jgi:hypothetical protein
MFPKESNEFWPLPSDYYQLSRDGQREARIAVCRDCSSRDAYVAGHLFFMEYYLFPEGNRFWKEGGPLPPAPGHILMLEDFFDYPMCVEAYLRGGGKTTNFGKILPLREVVCFPGRQVVVCSASDKLLADKANAVMIQLEENERIIDDFGRLVPRKGQRRIFNKHYMGLLNESVLEEVTIGSKQLGTRTSRYILDDPEYDPDNHTQERYTDLREKLERFLERDVVYMLRPGFMKLFWVGTMRGSRSYLYHVCYSKNPKYDNWARRIQAGATLDEDGNVIASAWEEKFSIKHLKFVQGIDSNSFMTEIMNAPVKETARLLHIEQTANEYIVDKPPANLGNPDAPHLPDPDALMTYHYFTGYDDSGRRRWQIDIVKQREHFDKMLKVLTFDYAETRTSMSDLKALWLTGVDGRGTKWLLDLWAGRKSDVLFWDFMILWAAAWRVDIIAPETIARQRFLVETIQRKIQEGEERDLIPANWHPAVPAVEYPAGKENISKPWRIKEAFEYSLPRGGWKFPASYKNKWPFNECYRQFTFFTMDLSELKRDDIIDAGSMEHYVKHGKGTAEPTKGVDPVANIEKLIRTGQPLIPGEKGLVGMPLDQLRPEYLAMMVKQQYDNSKTQDGDTSNVWDKPMVVGGTR